MLPLLTLTSAAEMLAVSTRTLRRAIDSNALPVIKIGKAVRIHPDDLSAYINRQRRYPNQCQSTAVVAFGGSPCHSTANELESLLAPTQQKRRP